MDITIQNKLIISIDNDNYEFQYIQDLVPECENGQLKVVNHSESEYKDYPKNRYGEKEYCSFKIDYEKNISGVYLWVIDNKIIYIGETDDFAERFNIGYGNISPYNCTIKGQVTNCKMNNVVLELFRKNNKIVHLYFMPAANYKAIEEKLLSNIKTEYNSKNNKN